AQTKRLNLDFVPAHLRYNINNSIGLGIGALTSLTISENTAIIQRTNLLDYSRNAASGSKEPEKIHDDILLDKNNRSFTIVNASVFADLQLGLVRKGPALGIKYLQGVSNKYNRIFMYLSFKL